jgi:hypothetical protein
MKKKPEVSFGQQLAIRADRFLKILDDSCQLNAWVDGIDPLSTCKTYLDCIRS